MIPVAVGFTPFEVKVIRDTFKNLSWLTKDQTVTYKSILEKCDVYLEAVLVDAFEAVYRDGQETQ